jgi:hypothetical protein
MSNDLPDFLVSVIHFTTDETYWFSYNIVRTAIA